MISTEEKKRNSATSTQPSEKDVIHGLLGREMEKKIHERRVTVVGKDVEQ